LTDAALKWQGSRIVSVPARPPKPQNSGRFWELANELNPLLYATALRMCRDPVEARDLVQDTFECGLRDFWQLRPGSNIRGWLCTILYHRFMDRCRARTREPQPTPIEEVAEVHAVEEPLPAEAWERVTFEDLLHALERLEEPFRAVYRLAAIERRPYKEISQQLGIPLATVGTRLLRARAKLKALLLRTQSEGEVE
jgi:RNA polymerase sigma-70 factor, ECF subfamily